jgi:hypothetical protein
MKTKALETKMTKQNYQMPLVLSILARASRLWLNATYDRAIDHNYLSLLHLPDTTDSIYNRRDQIKKTHDPLLLLMLDKIEQIDDYNLGRIRFYELKLKDLVLNEQQNDIGQKICVSLLDHLEFRCHSILGVAGFQHFVVLLSQVIYNLCGLLAEGEFTDKYTIARNGEDEPILPDFKMLLKSPDAEVRLLAVLGKVVLHTHRDITNMMRWAKKVELE